MSQRPKPAITDYGPEHLSTSGKDNTVGPGGRITIGGPREGKYRAPEGIPVDPSEWCEASHDSCDLNPATELPAGRWVQWEYGAHPMRTPDKKRGGMTTRERREVMPVESRSTPGDSVRMEQGQNVSPALVSTPETTDHELGSGGDFSVFPPSAPTNIAALLAEADKYLRTFVEPFSDSPSLPDYLVRRLAAALRDAQHDIAGTKGDREAAEQYVRILRNQLAASEAERERLTEALRVRYGPCSNG